MKSCRDTCGCCYTILVHSYQLCYSQSVWSWSEIFPFLAHLNHLLPNMKHWRGLKELHDCTSQQWGYTKNTNSAELDVCFSSVWACNYFALFSSVQSELGGVGTAWCLWQLSCKGDVGQGYMLTQLVGFWLQELCVRRAKSWMEVIMCNLPICLHVIPKPWIINFIQVTIL